MPNRHPTYSGKYMVEVQRQKDDNSQEVKFSLECADTMNWTIYIPCLVSTVSVLGNNCRLYLCRGPSW